MKRWNLIKPYDESTLPPVGKKVLVISDDGCAVWWTYLPPQIGKTYTNGDPEGEIYPT